MRKFLECVAEAIVEHGVRGLAGMVPGGAYAFDIANSAWQKYRDRHRDQELQQDVLELAQANFQQAKAAAIKVAHEAIAQIPAQLAKAVRREEDQETLELYLAAIPESVRQSLKCADNMTFPMRCTINSAEDMLRLLPARPPRFREGDQVPGKPEWELKRLLGVGGFGEVWFAQHRSVSSLNGAMKFCIGQAGQDLIHEADLVNRVMEAGHHPNIVPLKDAHLEGECPWLLFEYVAGGNLADWIYALARKPSEIRLPQTIAALRQITSAVAFFHSMEKPIVHRDLKPSNVLFDKHRRLLRITDFGIGSVTGREANRIASKNQNAYSGYLQSHLFGSHTPIYSSPEQRRGDAPDPRDDVHAIGVIAYQMLTGNLESGPGPRAAQMLSTLGVTDRVIGTVLDCVSEVREDRPTSANTIDWSLADSRDIRVSERSQLPSKTGAHLIPHTGVVIDYHNGSGVPRIEVSKSCGMEFVWIPAGEFMMGSPDTDRLAGSNEKPQRRIRITEPFLLGRYQVTQEEWKAVMGTLPWLGKRCTKLGVRHAASYMSQLNAIEFARKLSERDGVTYRLPTEAQWEYSCRAGVSTRWSFGDQQLNLDEYAWWGGGSGEGNCTHSHFPHEVGTKQPNAFGLFDMHGNVYEWCLDMFDDRNCQVRCEDGPNSSSSGQFAVIRGGSWYSNAVSTRAAFRSGKSPFYKTDDTGFRLLMLP